MEPTILFQNKNFLVLQKPAGMIVNRADTAKNQVTLQDWVEEKIPTSNLQHLTSNNYVVDGYNKYDEFKDRSGIVHRLDKETSGIILVAKNVETFMNLQAQFKNGTVQKTYLALVHGDMPQSGEINEPIGRLPWNRTRFGILKEGRQALTAYKTLEYKMYEDKRVKEILSLVEVYPKTGRTHQIRVHFQHINHPIFADALYAGRKTGRNDRKLLPSHFLHASKITFLDPETNTRLFFETPLPMSPSSFLKSLQKKSGD